ncbi:MAG: FtsX-like permease family protein [bacterium]|nr:FtsX-like permease family protein [bacterium]
MSVTVIAEVALCVVLLVTAGLLTKSFVRLLQVDLGFQASEVVTARVSLPRSRYSEPFQRTAFADNLLERVGRMPGVEVAAAATSVPLGPVFTGGSFDIEGRQGPPDWTEMSARFGSVTPGYFAALRIPLLRGRVFDAGDREDTQPVVLVNELLAQRIFPGEDPIGKRIRPGYGDQWCTIVGVVGSVRHAGPEQQPPPEFYRPLAQSPSSRLFLIARGVGPSTDLISGMRAAVRDLDPEIPLREARTMEQAVSNSVATHRHVMSLVDFFAAAALALAAAGLGGLMWFSVVRRAPEIGIRMALGAQRTDVFRMVFATGAKLTVLGLLIGMGLAMGATWLLPSVLFGVRSTDPFVFAVVPLLLLAVAFAACYVPARRASKLDPMAALRYE